MTKKPPERVEKGSGVNPRTISKKKIDRSKTAKPKVTKVPKQTKKKKPGRKDLIALKVHARRKEVRRLILEGKNGVAIARILNVSRKTIVDDLRILREEVMGFIESNEDFLTKMAADHAEITNELNIILKEECVTFKGGEEQPSAFLKIECLKTRLTSNKDFSELLLKLGKIKQAPEEHNVRYEIGWNESAKPKKKS